MSPTHSKNSVSSEPLTLRDDHIIETIAKLQRRISERFPESGLSSLCGELLEVARQSSARSEAISRPNWWIRGTGYVLTVLLIVSLIWAVRLLVSIRATNTELQHEGLTATNFLQTLEAVTNESILLGAGIYFLVSIETRLKRRRALRAIHELRSISHIIDMHQLTKDPERTFNKFQRTANSPQQLMTSSELNRYLDYCTEMLSLVGKIAALYIKKFDDPALLEAVADVEQLSTGLSRKIWQKITILQQSHSRQLGDSTGRDPLRNEDVAR